jgi:3-hydroxy-3-methylglutaryl CoA synthase
MFFGDGAVALLIGTQNVIAEVEHFHSIFDEIQDVWRSDKDLFIRTAEALFSEDYGYARVVKDAVSNTIKKFDLKPEAFSAICSNFPNINVAKKLFSSMGFQPDKQMQDDLHRSIGDTGTAMSLMYLVWRSSKRNPTKES